MLHIDYHNGYRQYQPSAVESGETSDTFFYLSPSMVQQTNLLHRKLLGRKGHVIEGCIIISVPVRAKNVPLGFSG